MFDSDTSDFIFVFQFATVLGILCGLVLIFDSMSEQIKKVFSSKIGFKETFQNIFEILKVFTLLTVISFVVWLGIGFGYLLLEFIIFSIF
jgi:hypothetical protein